MNKRSLCLFHLTALRRHLGLEELHRQDLDLALQVLLGFRCKQLEQGECDLRMEQDVHPLDEVHSHHDQFQQELGLGISVGMLRCDRQGQEFRQPKLLSHLLVLRQGFQCNVLKELVRGVKRFQTFVAFSS